METITPPTSAAAPQESGSRAVSCIAIDDEPLALEVIRKFCSRMGNISLTTFSDPLAGLEAIKLTQPDIVFLDIEMENVSGLTLAADIPAPTCIIFTTAFLEYAFDSYEVDAVDYLHKPFAFSRFERAVAKAMRRLGPDRKEAPEKQTIVVKQDYNSVNIALSEISYIEAMEGYVKIFRTDGSCVISRTTLKNISSMLPEKLFLRIHRSFIVARRLISAFNRREIELRDGRRLPIGRQYAPEVAAALNSPGG